jgi:hypothetical protein
MNEAQLLPGTLDLLILKAVSSHGGNGHDGRDGLLATWIPAQRALSVDPMMLLREE